jgi:hypothetical protein
MTRGKCTNMTIVGLAIILIVVIAGFHLYAYTAERDAVRESIRDELKTAAGIMATQINASDIAGLQPGDESSPRYAAVVQKLKTLRSQNDQIVNAYIMRVGNDGTIRFLVDDLALDDPQNSAKIGEVYNSPDSREIFSALSLPTASESVYTDQWGTFISGYAPIDDSLTGSNGNTTAVLGIDMAALDYRDRVAALSRTTAVSGIASMICALGLVALIVWVSCSRRNNDGSGMKKE